MPSYVLLRRSACHHNHRGMCRLLPLPPLCCAVPQWDLIVAELGTGRLPAEALRRYMRCSRPEPVRVARSVWDPADDQRLRHLVALHGQDWVVSSAALASASG